MPLLEIEGLSVTYGRGRHAVRALHDVSLAIERGQTLGLVGESGCGKSTLGRAIVRLERTDGGRIIFDGVNVASLAGTSLQRFRCRAQMVFQDPYASLNPRLSIGRALAEAILVHGLASRSEADRHVRRLLGAVGLDGGYAGRYPHEFSGGQRQRIGIARALSVNPIFVIADEPVSALDVSVQVQILNLLKDLQRERGLTYLFIAHDLAVVRYVCDRAAVMFGGRIVETGIPQELFACPAHPYTRALVEVVPDIRRALVRRRGPPHAVDTTSANPGRLPDVGCPYARRCLLATDLCRRERPLLRAVGDGRLSACHLAEQVMAGRGAEASS